ncbi:MAG TPA: PKD domain-containing protein, partial [Nitrososphaeraceae archaeon]|nr:PKD domain-containing protein [Nitrososphaeraceae archaeon]
MRITTTITAMVSTMLLMTSLSLLYVPSFSGELAQGQVGQQQAGNVPPIANTSPDQRVNEADLVTLNGSGSFDPDGKIVSYTWGIEDSDDEAPPVSLNGQNTSIATFTAPMVAGNVNANS